MHCMPQVGYTRACKHAGQLQLPEGVLPVLVKPNLMYLYGVDKALVTNKLFFNSHLAVQVSHAHASSSRTCTVNPLSNHRNMPRPV